MSHYDKYTHFITDVNPTLTNDILYIVVKYNPLLSEMNMIV